MIKESYLKWQATLALRVKLHFAVFLTEGYDFCNVIKIVILNSIELDLKVFTKHNTFLIN
jgi:hypothetical protein